MPRAWPEPAIDPSKATTKEADIRTVLIQEYSDHGQWARHYSTVRMTLGTFFITAATGIITLRWDKPNPEIGFIAGIVFALGVVLFMVFSDLTFRKMTKQREIVNLYSKTLGFRQEGEEELKELSAWGWGTGLPIALVFVGIFAGFDAYWLLWSKPALQQETRITVPIKLQVGSQPEATIDLPIKVVGP